MPSTQSQSLVSKVQRFLSGLLRRPHPVSKAEPPSAGVNLYGFDVLPERTEPIHRVMKYLILSSGPKRKAGSTIKWAAARWDAAWAASLAAARDAQKEMFIAMCEGKAPWQVK